MEDDIAFLDKIANEPWRIRDEALIQALAETGIKADQPFVARYMRLRAVGVSKAVEEALGNKHTWVQVYLGLFRRPTVPVLFWSHENAFLVVATNLAILHDITVADVADATATLRGYCAKRACFIGHLPLSVGLPRSSDDDEALLADISLRDEDDDVIMREPELPTYAPSVAFVSHAKAAVEYLPLSNTTSFGASSALQSASRIAPLQPSMAHNLPPPVEQLASDTFFKPHQPSYSWNNAPSRTRETSRVPSFASTDSAFQLPSTATSNTFGATSTATSSPLSGFSTATNSTFGSFSTTPGSTPSRPSTVSGAQTTLHNDSSFMNRRASFAAAYCGAANATVSRHTPSTPGEPSMTIAKPNHVLHVKALPTRPPVGGMQGSPRDFSAHRRPASVYLPGRLRENSRPESRRRVEQRMEQRRILGRGTPRPTSMYELGTSAGHASLSAAQCPQVDIFRPPSSMIPSFSSNDYSNDHNMEISSKDNGRHTLHASTTFWAAPQRPAPTPNIPHSRLAHTAVDYNNSTPRHIRFLD